MTPHLRERIRLLPRLVLTYLRGGMIMTNCVFRGEMGNIVWPDRAPAFVVGCIFTGDESRTKAPKRNRAKR